MVWHKVGSKDQVPSGKGKEFKIEGKRIAVFNQDGYHALDSMCVHQDGSIAPGKLKGTVVECPLHFWHYDIKTGKLLDYQKGVQLEKYNVKEEDGQIYIDV
ncbi:MAG: Rieske (2Fe-2S) domain protein [Cenarchaeum symbiont of Oopsacas minuta]|nr:Rieske (2Fe-2S) domain protein [Cenarchaeum symbiont of Oopsacas minuta]